MVWEFHGKNSGLPSIKKSVLPGKDELEVSFTESWILESLGFFLFFFFNIR